MTQVQLVYIAMELTSAIDTGNYDDVPMSVAQRHIADGTLLEWLEEGGDTDLSLLQEDDVREYLAGLQDILGAYGGRESRKWGIQNRALPLILAWTLELIQRQRFEPQSIPLGPSQRVH